MGTRRDIIRSSNPETTRRCDQLSIKDICRYGYELASHFSNQKFTLWSGLVRIEEGVHDDVTDLGGAFAVGDVSIFVVDIEQVHQVTTQPDEL